MSIHRILFKLSKKLRNNELIRFIVLPIWKYSYKIRRQKSIRAFHMYGEESIKKFFNNIDIVNIPVWFEFGTLLGAYRNGNFIPNDIDIDLGTFLEKEKELDIYLRGNDFKLVREFKIEEGKVGIERTYSYKGVFIDIFYFIRDNNVIYTYGFEQSTTKDGKFIPVKYEFPYSGLTQMSFLGIPVIVPKNSKEHLSAHYGENFMIPDPNFSDKNAPNRINTQFDFNVTYEEFN